MVVEPIIVNDVLYQAYCNFLGCKMRINRDLDYTFEGIKHLVTHETYPGHTTHMQIRMIKAKKGEIPLDSSLVITNTACSLLFEGIADNGLKFLNWMEILDDEISDVIQKMKSAAGITAAHILHEEGKSDEEVKNFLFADENWINSRMRLIKHNL